MTKQAYQHWQLFVDSSQILWLTLDRQGASVNSLNREVFDELNQALDEIIELKPKGVVLQSGKKRGFIAGADINQFTTLTTEKDAFDLIRHAQRVLDKLEALPMPTVAMIRGFCLGGGCEVALACRYRVAEDAPDTKIGLPEVKLGIHPGWGGTVRLPRILPSWKALRFMVFGTLFSARDAAHEGIVHEAVPARALKRAAVAWIEAPGRQTTPWFVPLSNSMWVRPALGWFFKREMRKKARESQYPAPFAIINNWLKVGVQGPEAFVTEAESIASLLMTDQSRQLVRVFFLQDLLKAPAKAHAFSGKHVHVVGAGTMGGDIAAWCALQGFQVTLQDQTPERIAPAMGRAAALFKRQLRKSTEVQAAWDRISADPEGRGVVVADLVIEAIFEDLNAKRELYAILESRMKQGAILATNTSTLPLEQLAETLIDPGRFVGIHFFNPVARMQLVEVIHGTQTRPEVLGQALAFVTRISRLPLTVKSSPGFLVNRLLIPYLVEAMRVFGEGVPAEVIDEAVMAFGMPMGPMRLADQVGLDVCVAAARVLDPDLELPLFVTDSVKAGHLGVKTGRGFYQYEQGKPMSTSSPQVERPGTAASQAFLADRLILSIVNEAVAVLAEGIVADADTVDAGMVFGAGFAPFRGGPLAYVRTRGAADVRASLQAFSERYGARFAPHAGWEHFV